MAPINYYRQKTYFGLVSLFSMDRSSVLDLNTHLTSTCDDAPACLTVTLTRPLTNHHSSLIN